MHKTQTHDSGLQCWRLGEEFCWSWSTLRWEQSLHCNQSIVCSVGGGQGRTRWEGEQEGGEGNKRVGNEIGRGTRREDNRGREQVRRGKGNGELGSTGGE